MEGRSKNSKTDHFQRLKLRYFLSELCYYFNLISVFNPQCFSVQLLLLECQHVTPG